MMCFLQKKLWSHFRVFSGEDCWRFWSHIASLFLWRREQSDSGSGKESLTQKKLSETYWHFGSHIVFSFRRNSERHLWNYHKFLLHNNLWKCLRVSSKEETSCNFRSHIAFSFRRKSKRKLWNYLRISSEEVSSYLSLPLCEEILEEFKKRAIFFGTNS